MLKLTYSNADVALEQLDLTVEAVVTQRSLVAVRAGQPLVVQPSYASFSLPAALPGLQPLRAIARGRVEITVCDDAWLEVTLRGTWLADSGSSTEGILVVDLDGRLERHLVALWHQSLAWTAIPCPQGR